MYTHPVYFASVNNLTVARYAAAMNIDYVGFCFEPDDPKFITVSKARAIMGWLSGVRFIGEFQNKPADEIIAITLELKLDAVFLKDTYSKEEMASIPCKIITVAPNNDGDYILEEDKITAHDGSIFALRFVTESEDITGMVDFTNITEALEKLED